MTRRHGLTLVKLAAGYYVCDLSSHTDSTKRGRYIVERSASGWCWRDERAGSRGGEWRASFNEAVLDLHDFTRIR